MKQVDMPRFNDVRERVLTDYEFRKLLNASWEVNNRGAVTRKTMDHHTRLALVTADFTGMRIGEVLDLKWKNVDLINGLIFVPKSKNGSRRLSLFMTN